jgi:hypothetical protein
MRYARAGDHGFAGRTPCIDACAADKITFNERNAPTRFG